MNKEAEERIERRLWGVFGEKGVASGTFSEEGLQTSGSFVRERERHNKTHGSYGDLFDKDLCVALGKDKDKDKEDKEEEEESEEEEEEDSDEEDEDSESESEEGGDKEKGKEISKRALQFRELVKDNERHREIMKKMEEGK